MSFFGWGKNGDSGTSTGGVGGEQPGRNLQDGLFQIASQACHILVQVNNTHNVSYGGSNNVTNVAYSKYSTAGGSTTLASSSSTMGRGGSSSSRSFPKQSTSESKDQDVVVLLPQHKSRTPRNRHVLSTVAENARLEVNSQNAGDDELELWDQSGFMLRSDGDDPLTNAKWGAQGWCRPSCIPITVILILIILVVLLPLLDHAADKHASTANFTNDSGITCMDSCRLSLVESIPVGLAYDNDSVRHPSIYNSWMDLISSAQSTIEIAALYWTLRRQDVYPDDSAKEGEDVFAALLGAGRDREVRLRFVQNIPSQLSPNDDTEYLAKKANAQVKSLNFASFFGGGVLHTKLWIIDRTHVFVGSANMDWRSLTQVKELGLLAMNCSCLATDLAKIFDVYWKIAEDGKIPSVWPTSLETKINVNNPMNFTLDDNKYRAFFASSPPPLSPPGRTNDIDAILHCIDKAEKFVYVSVMDYFPLTIYTPKIRYWPIIDDALRTAAIERKIHVKLLISWWKHSRLSEDYFLKSLTALTKSYPNVRIEVKRFIVPTNSSLDKIPFGRVNHSKYMVTDSTAYIGTSNWSGDYFIDTAGIGVVFEDVGHKNRESLRQQLEDIFNRDWNSRYAHIMNDTYRTVGGAVAVH